eukprot:m.48622 g.48622  ORF g.48622 m.48622 type:complete len:277 (-) comp10574_c0_seq3:843-1673(-)
MASYETLEVSVDTDGVASVALNRPKKLNAMNLTMWQDLKKCFETLDMDGNVRVVVLHQGKSRIFTAGLDLSANFVSDGAGSGEGDVARKALRILPGIRAGQDAMTSLENCRKPVICAMHGPCIGAGVDLCTAADIRYGTSSTSFCVKEAAVGLAADVGTLQRLPKVIGSDSLARELAFTARTMGAKEALECGLISKLLESQGQLLETAFKTAREIAAHSPVAILGTKISLNYSRDHTTKEGLDHIAMYNSVALQSEDLMMAMGSALSKQKPTFSKL